MISGKSTLPGLLRLTRHPARPKSFLVQCECLGKSVTAILDTGATCSVISSAHVPAEAIQPGFATPIKVANGNVLLCDERTEVTVVLGNLQLRQKCFVIPTDAFALILGMDFVRRYVQGILLEPDRLVVSGQEFPLNIGSEEVFRVFKTESYQLLPKLKEQAIRELSISPSELNPSLPGPALTVSSGGETIVSSCNVDLFASAKNRNETRFCSAQNSAWQYNWKEFGLSWANPPYSKIHMLLTKVALEETDLVLLTPVWGRSKIDQPWTSLLEKLAVRSVPLDRKSTRLNSSHSQQSRMPSSA